jgi:hypothetical protein
MANSGVRIVTPDEYPLWDELVRKSPQGTVFHMSTWITTCAELSSREAVLFGYYKNDQLVGGCSVYSYKKFHFLSIADSNAPMTPYGGYLLSPTQQESIREKERIPHEIIFAINNEMIKKFDIIALQNSPEMSDIRPFTWNDWKSSVYYTYYLSFEGNIEKNLSKDVQSNIQRARKNGITVKKENDSDVYCHLFSKTFEKQKVAPLVTNDVLSTMIDMIISNNLGEMWIARTPAGEPVAAEICLWDNKGAHSWSAALNPKFKSTGAASLVAVEFYQDLQRRGFRKINLMCGNTPNLAKFISGFNPCLVPYYRVQKMPDKYVLLHSFRNFLFCRRSRSTQNI